MAAISIKVGGAALLLLPFWVGAIAWLSGRVLGVRIGRWRSAVAGSIGWLLGAAAASVTLPDGSDSAAIVVPVVIAFGVLATLPVAIVLDLVARRAPRHGRRLHRWRHPIRVVRGALAPLSRFRELVGNARQEHLLHVRYRSTTALASPDLAESCGLWSNAREGCS